MNKNLQKARELEAEAKALRRAEKQFWQDIEDRKDEVIDYLNVGQNESSGEDNLMKLASEMYGISERELYDYITSDRQVRYYKSQHEIKTEDTYHTSF